ncbi:cholesterol transporter ABCA5-like [Saccostrea cucullata]|uniref:cholesterol transporter ABCA5-like n=1 Tax=Saccostrea cuccullata TaxID=36930 RepID=UPI002ED69297
MATFLQQFKTLMYKNILYKKRNKGQLIQEILSPIYFVAILAMTKAFLPLDPKPAITNIPLVHPENFSVKSTGKILVCPDTTYTRTIAADAASIFQQLLSLNSTPTLEYYPDDVAMVAAFKANYSGISGFTGLQFMYNNGSNLSYAIRMPINDIVDTKSSSMYRTANDQCRNGNGLDSYSCDVLKYLHTGFSMIQVATDTALLRSHFGITSIQPPDLSFQLMPLDKYQPDTSYIQIISSLYFVLAYAQFVNFLAANIVNDKEKKIKEGMKMMGLRDSAYWASWACVYFILITIVTAVVTLIAYVAQFYKNSNMFFFFLILEFYGMSLITFAWLITPFFQKAQTAGGIASLTSMLTSTLYLAVSMTRTVTSTGEVTYTIPPVGRGFLSLISPCGVALAIDQIELIKLSEYDNRLPSLETFLTELENMDHIQCSMICLMDKLECVGIFYNALTKFCKLPANHPNESMVYDVQPGWEFWKNIATGRPSNNNNISVQQQQHFSSTTTFQYINISGDLDPGRRRGQGQQHFSTTSTYQLTLTPGDAEVKVK